MKRIVFLIGVIYCVSILNSGVLVENTFQWNANAKMFDTIKDEERKPKNTLYKPVPIPGPLVPKYPPCKPIPLPEPFAPKYQPCKPVPLPGPFNPEYPPCKPVPPTGTSDPKYPPCKPVPLTPPFDPNSRDDFLVCVSENCFKTVGVEKALIKICARSNKEMDSQERSNFGSL